MQNSPATEKDHEGAPQGGPSDTPAPEQAPAGSDAELADLRRRVAELEDRYKRALADLDNYRKRSARLSESRITEARESMLREWLEAVDSVDRALATTEPDHPLLQGLRGVREQMEAILARQGVVPLGAPGEPFDPERHEAIAVREADGAPDHTILGVARSGYGLGDRVLRPAQVTVSSRGTEPGP
jgi:molecular chaperone GrpE